MSLFGRVIDLLDRSEIRHCLIGAAAMAAHGVPRSTMDLDLLTTDQRTLDRSLWTPLQQTESEVDIRRGDADDPLAGVIRAAARGERAVDVIVGRYSWQSDVVERATPLLLQDLEVAVAEPVDLVLLKLYAGGPQDRWDIQQLLAAQVTAGFRELVEERLGLLPGDCAALWRTLASSS